MSLLELGKLGNAPMEATRDHGTGLPNERALNRFLASGRDGHWALLTVGVKGLASADDERRTAVLRALAAHLGEILNDTVAVYRAGGGLAILVGPGEDLYETRHGTLLLEKAITRKLAEPFPPYTAVTLPAFSIRSSTDLLSRLRPATAEQYAARNA
ncbi:hypothetical protein [Actinomadura sp. 21ATH]|uniref:hypothetical protein n=1 Tax=Actinomadura sp. 21ATH TaxID=1735444 RepID=UPI0035BFF841